MKDAPAHREDPVVKRMERVAVVGAGVIGSGWAARFLGAGLDVAAWDPAPDAARQGAGRDRRRLAGDDPPRARARRQPLAPDFSRRASRIA